MIEFIISSVEVRCGSDLFRVESAVGMNELSKDYKISKNGLDFFVVSFSDLTREKERMVKSIIMGMVCV